MQFRHIKDVCSFEYFHWSAKLLCLPFFPLALSSTIFFHLLSFTFSFSVLTFLIIFPCSISKLYINFLILYTTSVQYLYIYFCITFTIQVQFKFIKLWFKSTVTQTTRKKKSVSLWRDDELHTHRYRLARLIENSTWFLFSEWCMYVLLLLTCTLESKLSMLEMILCTWTPPDLMHQLTRTKTLIKCPASGVQKAGKGCPLKITTEISPSNH